MTKAGRSVGTSGLGQKLGGVWGRQVWGKSWEECGDIRSGAKAGEEHGDVILAKGSMNEPTKTGVILLQMSLVTVH